MAETISMPKLGFDMAEGTLVRWLKKVGENVNKGEVLAEIETDKATVEVESSASGVVRRLVVDEGAIVPIGSPIAIIGMADEHIDKIPVQDVSQPAKADSQPPAVSSQSTATPAPVTPSVSQTASRLMVSPLARRVAREKSVDLSSIQGSGPGGRIVRRDIENVLSSGNIRQTPIPSHVSTTSDETVLIGKFRQAIGRRMTEAKTTIPHFYVTHEYKIDAMMEMREQFNKIVEEKTSINDFIVKAVALSLRQYPNLNASLSGKSVLRHGEINIGVAVAVEGGLMTVVCKNADQKPLQQISMEVKTMAARAREGKVKSEDIERSTFSISNLGMFDVENFSAIINPPEAAILAIGSAREVPVVEGGVVTPGWRMKATISVDHRVSDGAEAAKFMLALAIMLEEPLRLVI